MDATVASSCLECDYVCVVQSCTEPQMVDLRPVSRHVCQICFYSATAEEAFLFNTVKHLDFILRYFDLCFGAN